MAINRNPLDEHLVTSAGYAEDYTPSVSKRIAEAIAATTLTALRTRSREAEALLGVVASPSLATCKGRITAAYGRDTVTATDGSTFNRKAADDAIVRAAYHATDAPTSVKAKLAAAIAATTLSTARTRLREAQTALGSGQLPVESVKGQLTVAYARDSVVDTTPAPPPPPPPVEPPPPSGTAPVRPPTTLAPRHKANIYRLPGVTPNQTTPINAAWAACFGPNGTAQAGDQVTLPAGLLRTDGNYDVHKRNISIVAEGALRIEDVNTTHHGLRFMGDAADNVDLFGAGPNARLHLKVVGASGRGDQNQQGMATVLTDPSCDGFVGQDLILEGAKAAGFFAYWAFGITLNRVHVEGALADSFHFTNGSGDVTLLDMSARGCGDDGIGIVQYIGKDRPDQQPRNYRISRFTMYDQTHGRGFAIIGAADIDAEDLRIENSSAAGIIVGREWYGGDWASEPAPVAVRRVRIRNAVLVNCNRGVEDHGSFLAVNDRGDQPRYLNPATGQPWAGTEFADAPDSVKIYPDQDISDVVVTGLHVHNPRADRSVIRGLSYRGGSVNVTIDGVKITGTNSATVELYSGNLPTGSAVTITNVTRGGDAPAPAVVPPF